MRVLVDIYQLKVAKTGIRKYVEELITLIKENGDKEFDYVFFPSLDQVISAAPKGGMTLGQRLTEQWKYFYHKQVALPRAVKRLEADFVVIPDYYAPMVPLAAHKIIVFHDTFFWENPERYGRLWWRYFRTMIMKGLSGRSSVLTISEHSKQQLKKVLPRTVQIDVLHHAQRRQTKPERDTLSGLGLGKEKYFFHVGVFEIRKNLGLLIDAFAKFKSLKGNKEIKLVLAGAEPTGQTTNALPLLKKKIEYLGLNGEVILPGYLSDAEIAGLYGNALAYVLPSSNEGFGYPILEAFAYNCPVLISNHPALMEVGGDAVRVFDQDNEEELSNSLEEICTKEELRQELIRKGNHRLAHFDRNAYIVQLEKLMKSYLVE